MEGIYINTLSLCMIVKNEEDVIGRCLKCVKDIFEALDYKEGKLVIHIGGSSGGKEKSIQRFINNVNKFPKRITFHIDIKMFI